MAGEGLQFFATNRAMETLSKAVELDPKDAGSAERARERRHRLQSGGYYFVDADEYMSHYLAHVDRHTMPERAVVEASRKSVFEDFLAQEAIGRVVVCVHGFNVDLHHAVTWFRILTNTMARAGYAGGLALRLDKARFAAAAPGSLTAFIGFSWPSNGSTFAYNRDQADAVASAPAFANLLLRLRAYGKKIVILSHSMGNYLACTALAGMVNKQSVPYAATAEYLAETLGLDEAAAVAKAKELRGEIIRPNDGVRAAPFLVERMVMIAPDVERRHVTKSLDQDPQRFYVGPFYSGLEHLVGNITNVYSRFDGALSVSTIEKKPKDWALKVGDALAAITPWGALDDLKRDPDNKWEMRLGSSAHPITAPANFASLNATEIAGRPIDHSDHIDSAPVAEAIATALGLVKT